MSVSATYAPPALPAADPATWARIQKTATEFEAAFLQVMLGEMFSTVETGGFGGGAGEEAFKGFLTESFSKSMAQSGGIGLSKQITKEMLKLQGLS